MPAVSGLDEVVELARVVRSGFVESRHFGMGVVVDPAGKPVMSYGDVAGVVLPRSTAKPLQAVGALVAGARLDSEQVAVAAGSHTGTDRHVEVVDRILAGVGLDRGALRCPPDWPEHEETRHRLIAAGGRPEVVRMNCSGKHAALLAATVAEGADPTRYLEPDAPVQRVTTQEIARLTGEKVQVVAVDGCGAPVAGVSLSGWARAFGRLVTAEPGSPEHEVAEAMRKHPELVGGPGHQNTEVMRLLPGVLAKGGAEGVIGMAAPDGYAVAVKVIDGNPRATTALGLALLEQCGVETSAAAGWRKVDVLGGGRPVGEIELTI